MLLEKNFLSKIQSFFLVLLDHGHRTLNMILSVPVNFIVLQTLRFFFFFENGENQLSAARNQHTSDKTTFSPLFFDCVKTWLVGRWNKFCRTGQNTLLSLLHQIVSLTGISKSQCFFQYWILVRNQNRYLDFFCPVLLLKDSWINFRFVFFKTIEQLIMFYTVPET